MAMGMDGRWFMEETDLDTQVIHVALLQKVIEIRDAMMLAQAQHIAHQVGKLFGGK